MACRDIKIILLYKSQVVFDTAIKGVKENKKMALGEINIKEGCFCLNVSGNLFYMSQTMYVCVQEVRGNQTKLVVASYDNFRCSFFKNKVNIEYIIDGANWHLKKKASK